ncbi:hypothetical protein H8356DRAFT_1422756 [Neocallimastix lanati (nom. inval.)]|nr:hypothetical protein H8356DRAFT_1422756 [Neocallimastix sp. JGI-2020a]
MNNIIEKTLIIIKPDALAYANQIEIYHIKCSHNTLICFRIGGYCPFWMALLCIQHWRSDIHIIAENLWCAFSRSASPIDSNLLGNCILVKKIVFDFPHKYIKRQLPQRLRTLYTYNHHIPYKPLMKKTRNNQKLTDLKLFSGNNIEGDHRETEHLIKSQYKEEYDPLDNEEEGEEELYYEISEGFYLKEFLSQIIKLWSFPSEVLNLPACLTTFSTLTFPG